MISGSEIKAIFSQNKDELVIELQAKRSNYYIKAVLTSAISVLTFPNEIRRARKNSIDLFTEVCGANVESVVSYDRERCMALKLNNERIILFKMFGRQSNIVLFHFGKVIALFKNHLDKDQQLNLEQLKGNEAQNFEMFLQTDHNYLKAFPTFGSRVQPYLQDRKYHQVSHQQQWVILQELKEALHNPVYSLIKTASEYRLYLLPTDQAIYQFADPISALNSFYKHFIKYHSFLKLAQVSVRSLEKQRKQIETSLAKAKKRLAELKQRSPQEIGDIIMAHMHHIPPRATEIELPDFHHQSMVTIRLKKDLTPQDNAAIYYGKGKNQKIEQKQLQQTVARKTKELLLVQQQVMQLNQIQDLTELKKYLKEYRIDPKGKPAEKEIPFRSFTLMGYTIWVGKSASNNDLLTQKYAHKNDMWLHAKDVSGSHVVLRTQGTVFPKLVIERAASLAAYYSKKRNESLCAVAYTLKKYVRKPKGSPPGQVVIQREKVILVNPER